MEGIIQQEEERQRKILGDEASTDVAMSHDRKVHLIVCAFYHESDGCHIKDVAEEGMNPEEIRQLMKDCVQNVDEGIEFVGFPDLQRGWYVDGAGAETRQNSEDRASKFYLWLNEYLDGQLAVKDYDLFDAGVTIEGEEDEDENDKFAVRIRRRRTVSSLLGMVTLWASF